MRGIYIIRADQSPMIRNVLAPACWLSTHRKLCSSRKAMAVRTAQCMPLVFCPDYD